MVLHLISLALYEENRHLENDDLSFQFLAKSHEAEWTPKEESGKLGNGFNVAKSYLMNPG